MNKTDSWMTKVGRAIGALFILAIVLVVPIFSFAEIGHFFHGEASRSAKPLEAMAVRKADAVSTPPRLFNEPLVTVTFDDGFETTYSKIMPLLQKYGIHTTQYVLSGTAKDANYVSWDQIKQMQLAGHEIACHSVNHPDLTTLDDEDLNWQLKTCKNELSKRFGPVYNFAAPYGAQDQRTQTTINKYFSTQRNTNGDPKNGVSDADVNLPENYDSTNIIGVTVRHDTTIKELQELVAYAKATNGWVVLTYHQADDVTSKFSLDEKDFNKQFAYLSGTDVRIVTMQQALQSLQLTGVEY
jgi:peptidoglycan/xylan/chitin deacetylase (PgdA/CDA1 family)